MAQIASQIEIGCGKMIISPLCDDIISCNFTDGCPRANSLVELPPGGENCPRGHHPGTGNLSNHIIAKCMNLILHTHVPNHFVEYNKLSQMKHDKTEYIIKFRF